ncbi:hypothetical protein ACOSP7_015221 [Xanthoceras sorbifolium]
MPRAAPIATAVWTAPVEGWYKLNVDTSLRAIDCLVGLGAVVRDCNGLFMAGLSQKLVGSVSIEIAEAVAILNGLQLAINSGFTHIIDESDAFNVVNFITQACPLKYEVGLIILDILSLSSRANVSFSFVPRSANSVAHALARYSFCICNVLIWLEDASAWLDKGLLSDLHA